MDIVKILLGLLGLNILVIAHELGHFIAAKAVGVKVEVFSIGWGPKLFSWRFKTFELALSALPLGGYCKMQGENESGAASQPGDMGYGSPWRRIAIAFSGPLFSILFAALLFGAMGMFSYSYTEISPKIRLTNAGAGQGLETGDIVQAVNGNPLENYADLQKIIIASSQKRLVFTILRQQETKEVTVTPQTDPENAIGFLPIEPFDSYVVINSIAENSAAARAGLVVGDTIKAIGGQTVYDAATVSDLVKKSQGALELHIERQGKEHTRQALPKANNEGVPVLGIAMQTAFRGPQKIQKGLNPIQAIGYGAKTIAESTVLYIKALSSLFGGEVKITKALSGPLKNSYFIGEAASQAAEVGARGFIGFMAYISLVLGIMNLLPIPLLDGGLIILYFVELIKGKAVSGAFIRIYQTLGLLVIGLLISLGLISDALFVAELGK